MTDSGASAGGPPPADPTRRAGPSTAGEPTPEELSRYAQRLFGTLSGAVTAAMVHLGDRLGLYPALAALGRATSAELAEHSGLAERWVREWLYNQAAAELVRWQGDGEELRFSLEPAAVAVLTDPAHPAHGLGMFSHLPDLMARTEALTESFRTGVGHPYDALGETGALGIERASAPWFDAMLVPVVLPAIDGMPERLAAGGRVADVGCGTGSTVLAIARAFPQAEVHGYEISDRALERARARQADAGLPNVVFHDARVDPLPADGSLDLVLTIDCLHDMTRPREASAAIRAALRPDGRWLLVEIKGRGSFVENLRKIPMVSTMYGISVLMCLSSSLSEPGGEGLGTLGLDEDTARAMADDAGFSEFRRLPIDHPVNAFYEVAP